MTKPTLEVKTPSAEIVANAIAEISITDAKGRNITLKKPGVLAQFRLVEVLGDRAKNEVYTSMVLPLIYVSGIDGNPVFQPKKMSELEALIQQLDEEGIEAVSTAVMQHFGKANSEADKAALKN